MPVTARLSGTSGDPEKKAFEHRRDGDEVLSAERHRYGLDRHQLPAFFARTPDEFLAATEALTPIR